jgi:protein TonB
VIDAPPEPVSHGPNFWVVGTLALFVVACAVGLALQLGAFRSELVDGARRDDQGGAQSPSTRANDLPKYGEYVYVDEFPHPLNQVAPQYPDRARELGVSGTVIVQALVGKDGRVEDTKIVNSIPELDDAAQTAVRQWTFKPARVKDDPVAVWVAVPVKFTLN